MKKIVLSLAAMFLLAALQAQPIQGKIFDADTKEPLANATIKNGNSILLSGPDGSFNINSNSQEIEVSFTGYLPQKVKATNNSYQVALHRQANYLQDVVVTANRDMIKRIQAPVAIASISSKTINETKATTIDQLINKSSGVYMVNLGNEQHAMGIRQPLGTRSLFLYLEDGIPVRTSGVFNHNALMEMNMAAVKTIEVIKGPGSSLYGGEAIGGVVNMLTQSPTAIPTARISTQLNNIGYKRADLQTGFTKGRWGVMLSGYYASRNNGFIEFTDFHKAIATARVDYRFGPKTRLENSFTWMDYYSDMTGSVDSAMFANQLFTSQQTFTYRKANSIRHRSTLLHEWSSNSKTILHAVYRNNSLDQNPSYRIRDDYRKQGSSYVGQKDLAHGEINNNSFKSYVLIAQHRQRFNWLNSTFIAGLTADASPNTAVANYIKIKKDSIANKYISYQNRPDSMLVNYRTGITNLAAFTNFEFSPSAQLRVVASLRYDAFKYRYNNYLSASAVSGAADTISNFNKLSPKLGITYNFGNNRGMYANYSQGFVPPQVSELYRAVKIPSLQPAVFTNYELGAWAIIIKDKLTADISIYRLQGKNAIISVRYEDGTFGNANAGATLHQGIEVGFTATPTKTLQLRFNGSYNKHQFKNYIEKGVKYNGNSINNAPAWMHNTEITYRPLFIKGLRLAAEWQKMCAYFMDPTNLYKYNGFDVINARVGYSYKQAELWVNIINVLDAYYAVNSSRSSFGKTYTVGEPRNFNIGISYDLGFFFTSKK
ncbi:MAG: hypothetical protein RL172_1591 [Bacteroidota bacterium]